MQRRDVLSRDCDDTLNGAARTLVAGILPGVARVPAMVIAFGRVQARGASRACAG